jgi:hypothetical protein
MYKQKQSNGPDCASNGKQNPQEDVDIRYGGWIGFRMEPHQSGVPAEADAPFAQGPRPGLLLARLETCLQTRVPFLRVAVDWISRAVMKRHEWVRSTLLILALLILAVLVAQSRRNCEIPGSSWVALCLGRTAHRPGRLAAEYPTRLNHRSGGSRWHIV